MTNTIQTLAAEMSQAFETAVRPTSGEKFRTLKDDAPAWMTIVCHMAHDNANILPDDWRYQFIVQAVDALADHEDSDEARNSLKPDIYTSELTGWLHSLCSRVHYLGKAFDECGTFPGSVKLLAAAQLQEKHETFQQVLHALQEVLDIREEAQP